ncbi:hypothetical protein BKA93DRAFT_806757 [Sparassis latifolia]
MVVDLGICCSCGLRLHRVTRCLYASAQNNSTGLEPGIIVAVVAECVLGGSDLRSSTPLIHILGVRPLEASRSCGK